MLPLPFSPPERTRRDEIGRSADQYLAQMCMSRTTSMTQPRCARDSNTTNDVQGHFAGRRAALPASYKLWYLYLIHLRILSLKCHRIRSTRSTVIATRTGTPTHLNSEINSVNTPAFPICTFRFGTSSEQDLELISPLGVNQNYHLKAHHNLVHQSKPRCFELYSGSMLAWFRGNEWGMSN